MKSKAFVCFCVDGQSDIDALRDPFEDRFLGVDENINVEFRQARFQKDIGGDLTSYKGVNADNIEQRIYKHYFKLQDQNSGLGWNDVTYIIHIIDLDGMYVQDENVRLFTDEELRLADSISGREKRNTLYFDTHIAARSDIHNVTERNERKKRIVEHLLRIDTITVGKKSVNYSLYYFSSNIDHALYGDANLSGPDKMRKAADFRAKYSNGDDFSNYLEATKCCTQLGYKAAWDNTKKRTNSLLRGTNINLLIDRILSSSIEDWT